MRIGLVGPPFISIPPRRYGGTELFLANLSCELHALGHEVTVYGNGESRLPCQVRWKYSATEWPLEDDVRPNLKNADHHAWAIRDAARAVDVLHLNDIVGLPFSRFVDVPVSLTIHHPYDAALYEQYARYPDVTYVAIAEWLARRGPLARTRVVHHGIPLPHYAWSADKADYAVFLGRMAPCKGPHLAIAAARRAGIPLKLAGEIQPPFRDYWDTAVKPFIDGRNVEFVGEADHALKCTLLSRARALLFPIQWEEPFGLVMIEALACGTPVLAFPGGAVREVVTNGVNGYVCRDVEDMAARLASLSIPAGACRQDVEDRFSSARMARSYLEVYEQMLDQRDEAAASSLQV